MKRILVPANSGSDWQCLLGRRKLHWKSGYSAMTAAACWDASHPKLPSDISDLLNASGDKGLASLELLMAVPEWEVELPGGDRPSQTDILAIARNELGLVILGVEAKVDEPFGPTLGQKKANASAGQIERIAYLESELGSRSALDDSIRYQLLHRTVSVLLTARNFHASIAVMLVQSLSPTSRWRNDFDAFVELIGGISMSDDLFDIKLDGCPRLLIGWCTGDGKYLSVDLPNGV